MSRFVDPVMLVLLDETAGKIVWVETARAREAEPRWVTGMEEVEREALWRVARRGSVDAGTTTEGIWEGSVVVVGASESREDEDDGRGIASDAVASTCNQR